MLRLNTGVGPAAMRMTIPFRCATRHQKVMKHGVSNAASRNLLE